MSGAATALAFPPADLGWLGLVSLAPLAFVFRRARRLVVASAAGAFGVVFFGMLVSWILLFGYAAFISLVLLQTAWVVAVLVAGTAIRDRLPAGLRPIGFATAFVAGEYLRAHLPFTGFTWGGLGYTQHDAIWILRLAPYTGVWGISFLAALTGALVAEGAAELRSSWKRSLTPLLIAAAIAALPAALPVVEPDGPAARVAAIQGNQPEDPADPGSDDLSVLLNHARLTQRLDTAGLAMVIWPEGAAGSDPLDDPELSEPLAESIRQAGVPFLVGARIEAGANHFRNRSLFFGPDAALRGHYDKTRLVPFGEFVPFRRFLTPLIKELEKVPKDGIPGRSLEIFEIPEGKFASVICFESTFPDLVANFVKRGARFIAVITDNASFKRTAASRQHLVFSQLRAAENRVWVAHVAVTGISGIVAPDGRVVESTGLFEEATLRATVRFATRATIYTRWGDWFPIGCVVFVAAFLIAGVGQGVLERIRGGGRAAI